MSQKNNDLESAETNERQIRRLIRDNDRLSRQLEKQKDLVHLYKQSYGFLPDSPVSQEIRECDRDRGFFDMLKTIKGRPVHLNQAEVIRYPLDAHLRLIAGAGSGKTEAICAKAAYLIQMNNVDPSKICMISCYSKVVGEIKRRISNLLNSAAHSFIYFGTFYEIIDRISKEFCQEYPDYKQLDSICHSFNDYESKLGTLINKLDLHILDNFGERTIAERVSFWVQRLFSSSEMVTMVRKHFDVLEGVQAPLISERFSAMIDDLGEHPYVSLFHLLQQSPEVRSFFQKKFNYIFIDEFQDITPLQMEIIKLISPPNSEEGTRLIVVGDDDQSIASSTGSDPLYMREFDQLYKSKTLTLMINYRSKYNIIQSANRLISRNKGYRLDKAMQPGQSYNGDAFIVLAEDQFKEAVWVCEQLNRLAGRRGTVSDILPLTVILYRSISQLQVMLNVLDARGIPYKIESDEDALAPFHFPKFNRLFLGWSALCNQGAAGWKTVFEELALQFYINDYIVSGTNPDHILADLTTIFHKSFKPVSEITLISKYISILKSMLSNEDTTGLGEVINKFPLLKNSLNPLDLKWVVDTLNTYPLWSQLNKKLDAIGSSSPNNGLSLSILPISASRGLAFDHVFIMGAYDGGIPHSKALPFKKISFDICKERSEPPFTLEEERRYLYIAMTRARKNLYITLPEKISNQLVPRSPFLQEVKLPFKQAAKIR